jgi:hypothetical protein
MTVALVVGAIAVVGAVVLGVTWRRGGDESHSVHDYHQTLETLRHLAERNHANGFRESPAPNGSASRSPAGRSSQSAASAASAAARQRTLLSRSGPSVTGAFQDDSTARAHAAAPSSTVSQLASAKVFYQRRARTLAASPPRVRARSVAVVTVVLLLIALVAVGVAIGPSHKSHNSSGRRASDKSPSVASTRSTASTSRSRPASRSRSSGSTVPANLQASSSSATSADYTAPGSSYTLTVAASNSACWILAEATSSGNVLWTGTLDAGQSQQISATGDVSLRVGAAFDVNVSVNRVPVVLPSGHGSPYDLNFQVT